MSTKDGGFSIDITRDGLVLTVRVDRVSICDDCPDVHVLLWPNVSREDLRQIAAGIRHLADKHSVPTTRDGKTVQ